jgi:hypothetical protein
MAKDDFKNLLPEERIKRLKELEKQKKKEIKEAETEIKKSQEELTQRQKWIEKVPIPQMAKSDFENLSLDEQKVQEAHKGKKKGLKDEDKTEKKESDRKDLSDVLEIKSSEEALSLEDLAGERVDLLPELINSQYALQLSQKPMQNLYQEMTGIKSAVEEKGYISKDEERRVEYLASAVEKKVEAGELGKYSFTEEVASAANLTRVIGTKLRNLYQSEKSSNVDYQR